MIIATITKPGRDPVEIGFEQIDQPTITFPELRIRHSNAWIAGDAVHMPFKVIVDVDHLDTFESLIDGTCFASMEWIGKFGYRIKSSEVWVLDEKDLPLGTYLLYHRSFVLEFPHDEIR